MRRVVTLFEPIALIAWDISEMITEICPQYRVTIATTRDQVIAALAAPQSRDGMAILHAREEELRDKTLHAALSAHNIRTLAIHAPLAGDAFGTWTFLPAPFTSDGFRAAFLKTARG